MDIVTQRVNQRRRRRRNTEVGFCARENRSKERKRVISVDGGQMNIHGAFLHVLTDAVSSVIVIIAGLSIWQWPEHAWVNYIDPGASLLMVTLIVTCTIPLRKCLLSLSLPHRHRLQSVHLPLCFSKLLLRTSKSPICKNVSSKK